MSVSGIIKRIILGILGLAVIYAGGLCAMLDRAPFFRSFVFELGDEIGELSPDFFATENVSRHDMLKTVSFDQTFAPDTVGHYSFIYSYRGYEETVSLKIEDTTPPVLKLTDFKTNPGYVPDQNDFITEITELSKYKTEMILPEELGYENEILFRVTDEFENSTEGTAHLYVDWMKSIFIELGDKITAADILYDPADAEFVDPALIEEINNSPAGAYTITATAKGRENTSNIVVNDTTPPELELKPISVFPDETVTIDDFVKSSFDLSGTVTFAYEGTEPDMTKLDEQQIIKITATDLSGNKTTEETVFVVSERHDVLPPVFKGLKKMTVVRGSTPDYKKGVSATDDVDGKVEFKVDDSKVDINKIGKYTVTYTAVDFVGNKMTKTRTVEVIHNEQDTKDLVAEWSESIGDFDNRTEEALACRKLVMTVKYNHEWGGDDPIWYGFTERRGNCYVHALCLKAVLDLRGFETILIHVRDEYEPHYWVLVKLDGVWKHIDATPAGYHPKYELMNDKQRLETLVNYGTKTYRDWDFSAYPACP